MLSRAGMTANQRFKKRLVFSFGGVLSHGSACFACPPHNVSNIDAKCRHKPARYHAAHAGRSDVQFRAATVLQRMTASTGCRP
jgi:hypothetical protein